MEETGRCYIRPQGAGAIKCLTMPKTRTSKSYAALHFLPPVMAGVRQNMKTDSLGQTLEQSLNNPESWIRMAEQQFLVADFISPEIRQSSTTELNILKAAGILKTTVLLLALCVENSLKAVKASSEKFKVDNRGLTKSSRGGGGSGHTLIALADEIEFSLSYQETILLKRLTEIGIWAGKYHAPIHHKAFEASNIENPKSLTLPHDLNTVKGILSRAAELAKVPMVIET